MDDAAAAGPPPALVRVAEVGPGDLTESWTALAEIEASLRHQRDARGRELEILPIPSPGAVVIDEFAGQWIALSVPLRAEPGGELVVYTAGFILFRVLDIAKPLGARRLEKLPDGWGVLMDDVLSGVYVAVVLAVVGVFMAGSP